MSRFGPIPTGDMARFWLLSDQNAGSCWEWRGHRHRNGYGTFRVNSPRRMVGAHRFAYEMAFGPIPPGMLVMHSCDNRGCVNPEHLRVGTYADNNRDSRTKGRGAVGATHGSRTMPGSFIRCDRCGRFGHSLHGEL